MNVLYEASSSNLFQDYILNITGSQFRLNEKNKWLKENVDLREEWAIENMCSFERDRSLEIRMEE